MNIRPVDLPSLRDAAVQAFRASGDYYDKKVERKESFYDHLPVGVGKTLAEFFASSTKRASLFYISGEMMDLARVAASSLPEFTLEPEDVPTPVGFMYFADPLEIRENQDGDRFDVTAVSWLVTDDDGTPDGSIHVWWWDDVASGVERYGEANHLTDGQVRSITQEWGPIDIGPEQRVPFSREPTLIVNLRTGEVTSYDRAEGIIRWMAVLRTIWLLMAQELASDRPATYDRAARRRAAREGREVEQVRVITLRRAHAGNGSSASDREYHHQWIVRGHWRQQWYPAREVHRPVWIAPHVKGPEGAPMLGGEKVYALRR